MSKKVQFDKASATSKVRLDRIKKIYKDCGRKRGDLSARDKWVIKKIAIKHLGYGYANYPRKGAN